MQLGAQRLEGRSRAIGFRDFLAHQRAELGEPRNLRILGQRSLGLQLLGLPPEFHEQGALPGPHRAGENRQHQHEHREHHHANRRFHRDEHKA